MDTTRRRFFQTAGMLAGAAVLGTPRNAFAVLKGSKKMTLSYEPYTLQLKHVFTISSVSRTTTPVVLTKIEYDGHVGYGEASMPPYLGETQESVMAFLKRVDLGRYSDPFDMDTILGDIDALAIHNCAAKASVDIALHDLVGKIMGQPWYKIWGFNPAHTPLTTYTIGIDTPDMVRQKTREAAVYKFLKVKLGSKNDKLLIETIRSVTDKPITTDVNQGWHDKYHALDMAHWLKDHGVVFLEQPMPKEMTAELAWLTERSPIPIVGDEGVQRLCDVKGAVGVYSGINIKLMKCTGLREARQMMTVARAVGLNVMIGCMTETSCGISAASQLSPIVDWADLDGNLLIANDCFKGVTVVDGKITLNDQPGIGVRKV